MKQNQYRSAHQNLGQVRARDDPTCGSGGCNQFNYDYDTHAWDNLMGHTLEKNLYNLPTMMRGAVVTRNKADSLAQTMSRDDNIGSSIGITQYLHPAMRQPGPGSSIQEI